MDAAVAEIVESRVLDDIVGRGGARVTGERSDLQTGGGSMSHDDPVKGDVLTTLAVDGRRERTLPSLVVIKTGRRREKVIYLEGDALKRDVAQLVGSHDAAAVRTHGLKLRDYGGVTIGILSTIGN